MNATFKAALWMIGAIVSFTLMAIAGRAVSHAADTFEIMLYRSLFGLIAVAIYLSATGKWRLVRTPVIGLHVTRNILHFTGQNLWFLAITLAPLALVFSMEFTAPLWVLVRLLFVGRTAADLSWALVLLLGLSSCLRSLSRHHASPPPRAAAAP